ncbi:MAG: TraX family protein, partial [Lachnospiraceae bacterium]|nr:TraX family protein [Lachnospiraceae bacterium]
DSWLRGIGRLAFPLFCFFIVEGFQYTHDRRRYAVRLGIFAVISEVPFDLAFNGGPFYIYDNNVMWTLLLGLLAIWALDSLFKKIREKFSGSAATVLDIVSIAAVVLAVDLIEDYALNSDYGASGVVAIIIMYLLGTHKLIGFALAVIWLGFTCGHSEWYALADLLPLYFYHGRQGRKMKYFFYIFYPAHLLVIRFIAHFIVTGM